MKALVLVLAAYLLVSCSGAHKVQFFPADQYPERLSSWGLISSAGQQLTLASHSDVYDLNTALFSDYAMKLRTLYLPPGSTGEFVDYEAFNLPEGSIISKTFFYRINAEGEMLLDAEWDGDPASINLSETKLVETRLLVKQAHGWDALPYIWRGDDAYLAITGDLFTLPVANAEPLNYLVPSKNQCAGCHATNHTSGEIKPIGIKARHLNRPSPIHGQNQLTAMAERGQLSRLPALAELTPNADFSDTEASLDHRARSYLDINCGHCHNAQGAADTSGLLLDYQAHRSADLGVCKPPIAAGKGSGGNLYGIVPGEAGASILSFRMNTTDPSSMMPELGRSLVHTEGHAVVSEWINAMQGECK